MTATEDTMAQAFQERAAQKAQARAEKEALIRHLWAQGEDTSTIAARLGISTEAARDRLRKLGLRRKHG